MWGSDPPENCHLNVKNCQKLENFWQFFGKKCQVFGIFLTVKWQFSGGSGGLTVRSQYQSLWMSYSLVNR